jgi:DnaK suppressor protein
MQSGLAEPAEPTLPGDPADMAGSVSAREESYEIGSVESRAVAQIDYVLRRIESGKYGICEDCGKRIPEARLRALPFAFLCVDCKQRDERSEQSEGESAADLLDLEGSGEEDMGELEARHGTVRGSRPA